MLNPTDLVHHALDLLLAKDMVGFADLWSDAGVLEFPFAAPGYPPQVVGRAAIRDYLRDYPSSFDVRDVTEKVVHQTTDPAVVIVEFAIDGVAVATAKPYLMRYIAVITVTDGMIERYRDYWSPLAAAEAMGGTDAVIAFAGGTA